MDKLLYNIAYFFSYFCCGPLACHDQIKLGKEPKGGKQVRGEKEKEKECLDCGGRVMRHKSHAPSSSSFLLLFFLASPPPSFLGRLRCSVRWLQREKYSLEASFEAIKKFAPSPPPLLRLSSFGGGILFGGRDDDL
jgi:hypothetical protein